MAASFEKLKQFFMNDLILKFADTDKNLVVCIDAFKRGLGGVLM